MLRHAYLAIDLGAESGRAIVGVLESGCLSIHEVHRFEHQPVQLPTGLHWNLDGIWGKVREGIRRAAAWAAQNSASIHSIGVDTWGVDFGLIDRAGELLAPPRCYRDPRNGPAFERAAAQLGREAIYDASGIQLMPLNTLFQLVAAYESDADLLARADQLLFMPDLIHYFLSGVRNVEHTIASTSQMIDARTGRWANGLLQRLQIPTHLLRDTVPPGHAIGLLRDVLARDAGLTNDVCIIAPAAHDTASAVAAVPATTGGEWCYLSSGTWSLLGAELDAPCITPAARDAPFTNEAGIGGTIRFLKNISGLWLVQECRRHLAQHGESLSYDELAIRAAQAPPFATLVDPGTDSINAAGDMPAKIAAFARRTGQPEPAGTGPLIRCCLESLALTYRRTLDQMQTILGRRFSTIHIVGGGSRNALLNQMTADATGRRVIAGPHEATAMGNILIQAMGAGHVRDRHEIRDIVARSVSPTVHEPHDTATWDRALARYAELCVG